jgi:hypothetical protein
MCVEGVAVRHDVMQGAAVRHSVCCKVRQGVTGVAVRAWTSVGTTC